VTQPWRETRHKYRDERVAREYDRRRYRGWGRQARERWHHRTLARALRNVPAGSRVLDLPCGTGRLLPWLVEQGYRVAGADIAAPMLGVARERCASPLLVAEAEALPFADATWDVVLAARFVHLVPAEVRPQVFKELARVSRGWVVLTVPIEAGSWKGFWRAARGKQRPGRLSRQALEDELQAAGLQLTRVVRKLPLFSTFHVLVCRVSRC
jgi:ubiquinone/menaquinone biosynthesis C-methylase UbiE